MCDLLLEDDDELLDDELLDDGLLLEAELLLLEDGAGPQVWLRFISVRGGVLSSTLAKPYASFSVSAVAVKRYQPLPLWTTNPFSTTPAVAKVARTDVRSGVPPFWPPGKSGTTKCHA